MFIFLDDKNVNSIVIFLDDKYVNSTVYIPRLQVCKLYCLYSNMTIIWTLLFLFLDVKYVNSNVYIPR